MNKNLLEAEYYFKSKYFIGHLFRPLKLGRL